MAQGQHAGPIMQRPRQRSASARARDVISAGAAVWYSLLCVFSVGGAYLAKVILVRAMTEALIAASDATRYPQP